MFIVASVLAFALHWTNIAIVIADCPDGLYPYVNQSSGLVEQCSVDVDCPPPFKCERTFQSDELQRRSSSKGFCCLKESTESHGCPPGQVAFMPKNSENPRFCSVGEFHSCPDGFYCQYSELRSRFQCCKLDAGCPEGGMSEIDTTTGQSKVCDSRVACSAGYACHYSFKMHRNLCCRQTLTGTLDSKVRRATNLARVDEQTAQQISRDTKQPAPPMAAWSPSLNGLPSIDAAPAVCFDWASKDCEETAKAEKCGGLDNVNWVTCCKSCRDYASVSNDKAKSDLATCVDRLAECNRFKTTIAGFCSEPNWSFFALANCYRSCYCSASSELSSDA